MSEQLPKWLLLSGICKGVKTVTENGYTNTDLFIKVGEFQNEIGEMQSLIERVSLFGDNVNTLMEKTNKAMDKHIVIAINRRPAKKDLRDAFMRNSINRQSDIAVLS